MFLFKFEMIPMIKETITAAEMKVIDANSVWLGLSPLQLMENAGHAVADIIAVHLNLNPAVLNESNPSLLDTPTVSAEEMNVLLFAGLGNNGGDAFVAARHLADLGIPSVVFLLGTKDRIKTAESRANYAVLAQTPLVRTVEVRSESDLEAALKADGINVPAVVDGIFGTGFSGEPRGIEKAAIEYMNAVRKKTNDVFVLAVDIPSGLSPEKGIVSKTVVRADATVTFHKMKDYLQTSEAAKFAGRILVKPIGIPSNAQRNIGLGDLTALHRRGTDSQKGDSGKVLVIAGGPYAGAPALAGIAALRVGCDIAVVAAPADICSPIASFAPELIVRKLSGKQLSALHLPFLIKLIEKHDAVLIGPGLGNDPEILQTAAALVPFLKKAVIDADALRPEILEALKTRQNSSETDLILTPHYREFRRIASFFGIDLPSERADVDPEELQAQAGFIGKALNAVILLKGPADTLVNPEDGRIRFNMTGNAGMTVGGTGDVLAGTTAGLLTTNDAFTAACCGAFVCGRAGDLVFSEKGDSLLPSDLPEKYPEILFGKSAASPRKKQKKSSESGKKK